MLKTSRQLWENCFYPVLFIRRDNSEHSPTAEDEVGAQLIYLYRSARRAKNGPGKCTSEAGKEKKSSHVRGSQVVRRAKPFARCSRPSGSVLASVKKSLSGKILSAGEQSPAFRSQQKKIVTTTEPNIGKAQGLGG
ncbi:hypothetical protein ZHAS_00011897 [Anopheles sinensis]|uniref:Uncharacterized protein n=1 Tax=Anopheles sinensis TaxID=74873 RepID=A0A084W1H2_ANOSI|nr:hypothetical protein ZHAS_00011897 [Anopheles sinensis]